ncbi:MAG: hypothetical protein LBK13_12380 [Spirochaetales bacterium]|jgi:hypothetical protein|nr:hypothetical protein [Spirochaetales bacterium]
MSDFQIVSVEKKKFIGIGKLMFRNTSDVTWHIPHLHFLVDNPQSGYYESTCLEFGLVSSGVTPEEAIERLVMQTRFFIDSVMEKDNYEQFISTVDNFAMCGYWRAYRKIEFSLAETGKDLSSSIDKQIETAVRSIIKKKIDRALDELANAHAREIIAEAKRMVQLSSSFDFQYTSLEAA